MKKLSLIFAMAMMISGAVSAQTTLHSFKTKTIDGKEFDLASLKGKKVLVVNTASKCGLTPQYKELEALYKKYKDRNFVIIGFPANNFLSQEPGTEAEIKEFCEINYGVTFPMMSKISVKGKDQDPIYKWLTNKSENGKMDAGVTWNFQKFMIDENGNLVDYASPRESPDSDKIVKWIEN
ncbi:MAG: glutathione peroxidase [Bacteroidales bacterium]|nr:glutathione peroxidase [Bacteroidales bacterium]MBK9358166.1 glutathione peroxidase [Bacteroidales bacterium]